MTYEIGIIGAGQMAEAIARGLLRGGLCSASQMIAADVSETRRKLFSDDLKIQTTSNNTEVASQCKLLLLSVKPYQMQQVLTEVAPSMNPSTRIISIAAGIRTGAIAKYLGEGKNWRVVRAMPNTPMVVGEGVVAIAPGASATPDDMAAARKIFQTCADVVEVREDQIDAVTALSGSGPAYFYYFVEKMTEAGIQLGLSAEQARQLAAKTCLGAGRMLLGTPESPQELRRRVTTPNGTTHAAITHMESHDLGAIIIDAVKAAHRRSVELGA